MDETIYVKSGDAEGLEKELSAALVSKNLKKEDCTIKYFGKVKEYASKETEISRIKADLDNYFKGESKEAEYSAQITFKAEEKKKPDKENCLKGESKEAEYSAQITFKAEEKKKPSSASPIFDNYKRIDSLF